MWDKFSTILNIILGLSSIYLYLENRRLKGFEIDRDIELKEIELQELNQRGPGTAAFYHEEGKNYCISLNKINAELNHLKRLKKYRWIFSK
jgi:hypothetical protein